MATNIFKVEKSGANQAAPGFVFFAYTDKRLIGKVKPSLVVAGDGSMKFHYLTPV